MASIVETTSVALTSLVKMQAPRLLAVLLLSLTVRAAVAQQNPTPGNVELMLIRNVLTAANHANITGNYTVLRDLGSPAFREKNSAAQLAGIFQKLREEKIDLSPVLVLDPQFTRPPAINKGVLQMEGYFPSQPLQVRFALAFMRTDAGWVLDGIAVGAIPENQSAAVEAASPTRNANRRPAAPAADDEDVTPISNTVPAGKVTRVVPADAQAPSPAAQRQVRLRSADNDAPSGRTQIKDKAYTKGDKPK